MKELTLKQIVEKWINFKIDYDNFDYFFSDLKNVTYVPKEFEGKFEELLDLAYKVDSCIQLESTRFIPKFLNNYIENLAYEFGILK